MDTINNNDQEKVQDFSNPEMMNSSNCPMFYSCPMLYNQSMEDPYGYDYSSEYEDDEDDINDENTDSVGDDYRQGGHKRRRRRRRRRRRPMPMPFPFVFPIVIPFSHFDDY